MAIFGTNNKQAPNQLDLEAETAKIQGQAQAMGGGGPIELDVSDLANQMAQQQTQTKLQETGIQQQQKQLEQQATQKKASFKAQGLQIKERFAQDTAETLQKFEQNKDLLEMDKYSAEVAQLLFNLRMQNTQYVDKLKIEGTKQRLMDQNGFKEAMLAAVFEDEIGLLKTDLGFRQSMQTTDLTAKGIMAADQRAWERHLADMDIEYALKVALSESDARNNAMKFEAITQIGQGIIKMGASAARSQNNSSNSAYNTTLDVQLD